MTLPLRTHKFREKFVVGENLINAPNKPQTFKFIILRSCSLKKNFTDKKTKVQRNFIIKVTQVIDSQSSTRI